MKAQKKSRNAAAGLLAVAGSIAIGGTIITANAKPPLHYYESDLLCAYDSSVHIMNLFANRTLGAQVRDACDHLATSNNFDRTFIDPPYAIGVVRMVDPETAGDVPRNSPQWGLMVQDCDVVLKDLHDVSTPTVEVEVEAGQVGCFGEGAPLALNITRPGF